MIHMTNQFDANHFLDIIYAPDKIT